MVDIHRMLAALAPGQLRLRMHGPSRDTDEVPAALFSYQLTMLVKALKSADRAVNGSRIHEYTIAKLQSSVPTVTLAERAAKKYQQHISDSSGIGGFANCMNAIVSGDRLRAMNYGRCAVHISNLLKSDGYSEVWTDEDEVFRIDSFLIERAKEVVAEPVKLSPRASEENWYRGAAVGAFDGEVKEVDLRGELPEITLILSAGGKPISCICRSEHVEDIRASLNRRARITGRAIYDGKSGLPRRLEVNSIEQVKGTSDFSRWKESFEPFESDVWAED